MKRIDTVQSYFFWVILLILFGSISSAYAQPFVVRGQCMANPNCPDDLTTFEDTVRTAVAWRWNFGDPAGGPNNISTRRNPQYSYAAPGTFVVSLVRTLDNGRIDSLSQVVQIGELPPAFQNWRSDTTICEGQTILLDPYPMGAPEGARFIWFPKGDTTQVLEVDSSGCYSVEVILPNGCKIQDRINVKICLEQSNQEGAKWFFGANAGLDFSGGDPSPITDGSLNTPEGTSSIANSKGVLLFYTDGVRVYDRDGVELPPPNGEPLRGSPNSSQSALIVPQPTCRGCEYLFNVFTTSDINDSTRVLTVSVVDMRRNDGKGAIVEQNTVLQQPTTERLAAVRNDADSTYWIVTHDYGTNVFRVFHATTGGLIESKTFALGMAHDTTTKAEGYMKFSSPDSTGQRKLAVIVPGPPTNFVELFNFTDSTGTLTYDRTIPLGPSPPKAYGVEFSPDGSKLYVSMQGADTTASILVQYDLSLGDSTLIAESRLVIDSSRTQTFGALQIGPNGQIYMAVDGSEYLAVIEEPDNNSVTAIRYRLEGVRLGGRRSGLGLPSFVQDFTQENDGPGIQADGFCVGAPTVFTASPLCDPKRDTYTWNFGDGSAPQTSQQTEANHTYRRPGIYTVTLRAQNECKDTTFTEQVEIFDTPAEIDLGQDRDECRNFIQLEARVDAELFVWLLNGRVAGREPVLRATQSGQYVAIAANGPQGECFNADTLEITLRRPPNFTLGPDTTVCNDSSIVLNAPGLTWREFKWSTGETTREITVRQPGLYFVEVKNANDCFNEDTIQVVARPRARVQALITPPTGCTTADGRIELVGFSPPGSYLFAWTLPDTTPLGSAPVLSDLLEGSYKLRLSGNPNACTTDTAFTVRSAANPLRMNALVENASCSQPDSGAIRLVITGGNPTIFRWRNNLGKQIGTESTLNNLTPGQYSLEALDDGGCTFSLPNVVVGLTRDNFADLGPDRLGCQGDTIRLRPVASNFAGNVYTWSTGATTYEIFPQQSGSYSLTIRNPENGCEASASVRVTLNPPPVVNAGPALTLCSSDRPHRLTGASPSGGVWSGTGIIDSTGLFLPSDAALGALSLTYMFTDPNGCSASAIRSVTVRPTPRVVLGPDTTLCFDGTFRLVAGPTNELVSYQWSNGQTTPTLFPRSSGVYSVRAAQGECVGRDTIRIAFLPSPRLNLAPEVALCVAENGSVVLDAGGVGNLRYFWPQTGDTTRRITVSRLGLYQVEATNLEGCTLVDTTSVIEGCEPRIFVPDAFSPNGDGRNDLLDIFGLYFTDFELKIYNRWGEVIFATQDINEKWDGVYREQRVQPGVYPYVISFKSEFYPERPRSIQRGRVIVLR